MNWFNLAIEAVKKLFSFAQKADNIELNKQLIEAQQKIQTLQQENFLIKQKNQELEGISNRKRNMERDKDTGMYFERTSAGELDGPLCPLCWEKEERISHLIKRDNDSLFDCKSCHETFGRSRLTPAGIGKGLGYGDKIRPI